MFVVDRLEYNSLTGRVNKINFFKKNRRGFRDGYMKADKCVIGRTNKT